MPYPIEVPLILMLYLTDYPYRTGLEDLCVPLYYSLEDYVYPIP